jgi:hypothetical protein
MKQSCCLFFLVLYLLLIPSVMYSIENFYIGMPIEEFKRKNPGIIPEDIALYKNFIYEKTYNGLYGKWLFQFYDGILYHISFDYKSEYFTPQVEGSIPLKDFYQKINTHAQEKFSMLQKTVINIYNQCRKQYGNPTFYKEYSKAYISPWEYDDHFNLILKANWKLENMEVQIVYYAITSNFKQAINAPPIPIGHYGIKITFGLQRYIQRIRNDSLYYQRDVEDLAQFYIPLSKKDMYIQKKNKEDNEIYIGMSIDDFIHIWTPKIDAQPINGHWRQNEEMYGISGGWGFRFRNNKLDWAHYNCEINVDDMCEDDYADWVAATEKKISEYIKLYGEPAEYENNKVSFKELAQFMDIKIIHAKWNNNDISLWISLNKFDLFKSGESHLYIKISLQ